MSNINIPTQVSPFVNRSQFPALGKIRVIYIDQTANVAYYWNNTTNDYAELGAAVAVNWGDITGTLADQTDLQNALNDKVDKVTGKGLSTNDYTTTEKDKLAGIEAGAQVNVNADWNATTGDAEILNKPTIPTQTSDLTNDGENGINPFITAVDIPGSLPPSGTAGGDLTGTYPNPTVHRIHGIDVQNGTPSADDVLVYGGSPAKWQHQHLNASQVDNDSSVTGTSVKLALQHLDSTKVPTSRTLTINGTTQDLSADRTFTISTGITIGTTAITSGTVGRVLFEGTGNVVQESANLFWDNTNGRLGIGTSSPSYDFDLVKTSAAWVIGRIRNLSSAGECTMTIANDVNQLANYSVFGSAYSVASLRNKAFLSCATTNGFSFSIYDNSSTANFSILTTTSLTERMRVVGSTGNVLINTTTDAGFKLDVNGTARVISFIDCRSYGSFRGDFYVYQAGGGGGFSITQTAGQSYLIGQSTHDMIMGRTGGYSFILKNQTRVFGMDDTTASALTNASALLTMTSTTKGFLPPRMTTTEKNAIASPSAGLMVYDTTLNLISVYNGTTWITL